MLRVFNQTVTLLALLAVPLLLATPATADPTSSSGWQLNETPGISWATDSHGMHYPYVTLPTGGRWYLECPMEPTNGGPAGTDLKPSIPLDRDHDRCGNDQGANAATYPGATWTTATFAD